MILQKRGLEGTQRSEDVSFTYKATHADTQSDMWQGSLCYVVGPCLLYPSKL